MNYATRKPKAQPTITMAELDAALNPIDVNALTLSQALRLYRELKEIFK